MRSLTALGLAVLRLLTDQPQHPYELQQQLREQGLDRVVKVTHGALYNTVDTLAKAELIEPVGTSRDGRRPERTVYSITAAGRDLARDRLRELMATLVPEYPAYCAALAFMSLLTAEDAVDRLERRCVLLEGRLAAAQAEYDGSVGRHVPRVGLVEMLHLRAHLLADLDLTRALIEEIHSGRLELSAAARP